MQMRLLLFAPLFLLSSCIFFGEHIRGNGHVISQGRDVGSFSSIDAGGSLKVHLMQGAANSLRIEADENLQPYIETYVEGGTLIIKTKNGYDLDPSEDIVVYTTAPQYRHVEGSGSVDILSDNTLSSNEAVALELSGSGNIDAAISAPSLSVDISGSGDVLLKGTAQEFKGSVSGSGSIKAFDLTTDHTRLEISGAADAEITANQTLDVKVSGSGDVQYKGAARVSQSVSGNGSVKKAG
jgi:hypothetical protein